MLLCSKWAKVKFTSIIITEITLLASAIYSADIPYCKGQPQNEYHWHVNSSFDDAREEASESFDRIDVLRGVGLIYR